jgi:CRP/FNR family transcriptional regulator, cyclic AMP receptor protein
MKVKPPLAFTWYWVGGSVAPNGIRLVWEFTHEDVAQMICFSRETVTRLLGEFSKRGLVVLTGNSLLVSQPEGLEKVAARKTLTGK